MGSTRLPGKVLHNIAGATMLARVVARVRRATALDQIVIATSTLPADDAIASACATLDVPCFRGSEEDVLARYYGAATNYAADVVVRITADCPLIEPTIIDLVVHSFLREFPDYASSALERSFPRGLDVEVLSMAALTLAHHEAQDAYQRVHVTPYIYHHPERFRLLTVRSEIDYSFHRWTVDTPEDLRLVQAIYGELGADGAFDWHAVLQLLAQHPELVEINAHVEQKELQQG